MKATRKLQSKQSHAISKGDAANVSKLCFGTHTATHVDAPNHFIENTKRVHELDLDKLIGKCRVVEIDKKAMAISAEHIKNLELSGVERILFKTRNSEFWNKPEKGFRKDFTLYRTGSGERIG
ncbi:MAG: cyclase family protein [Pyrinomonadaceae bacterium]